MSRKKRGRGRPATGTSPKISFRVDAEVLLQFAEVAARFKSQSEALRDLLTRELRRLRIAKVGD